MANHQQRCVNKYLYICWHASQQNLDDVEVYIWLRCRCCYSNL